LLCPPPLEGLKSAPSFKYKKGGGNNPLSIISLKKRGEYGEKIFREPSSHKGEK